ncbi:MAG: threonylcarbamoyl-AMP synthase [Prevotellaceae bacterium]|jgi:L-threonylcarbamoyladenylate synthase|nr:threonylcarbamoyl-AMP synthase [Prevotellaceae bacterium]
MINIIKQAAEVLRKGGIILYPTDTVWGLGCDACNTSAVQKIFELKRRREEQSMIVLVSDENMLAQYVVEVPEIAWSLIEVADKPLTIIYPHAAGFASGVAASDGSAGIRIPKHEFCVKLLKTLRCPLISTSANISGAPAPRSLEEISDEIINFVDFTVPRSCEGRMSGKPSSIIKLGINGEVKIIRE